MIKPTKLIIKNIGKIADTEILINKPLILFYGEIRQGKSTILNCVRWVCGGEFPSDIIQHGAEDGAIELHFDGGMIGRSFYRAKDKVVKARPVVFVRGGKPVASPVAEIKRLLNPFLLDQDFLRNKTELERKQYFTEMFAVDTSALDMELFNSQRDAQNLRSKIDGYGKIELVPVEPVDVSEVQSKLDDIREKYRIHKADLESQLTALQTAHDDHCREVDEQNEAIRNHNAQVAHAVANKLIREKRIADLEQELADEKAELKKVVIPKEKTLVTRPAAPNRESLQKKLLEIVPHTSALEKQIQDAGATNVRAEQYQKDKNRAADKEADEKKLSEMTKRQRDIKAEKQSKLKEVSATCGVPGLEFDEEGNFMYEGTTAGMISDSQLMKLSNALSSLYPDGFDVSLIDRGESLGKSIFEFVERAKEEKKTILATIVGERPAKVPPEIGVFVVEDGKVTQ